MAWEKLENIKGPKGDKGPAGTISSVSAETVEPGAPARAELTGVEDVHLHLELPRGAKGEQGPPGVASSASAQSVPADKPAKVILSQHGELVHAEFEIPRGAPGTNAVPTAEAIGVNLAMPDSAARPGLETGMDQVANDPASAFASGQKAKLDAGLSGKANLVGGKVPDSELGAATTATPATLPRRVAGGRLPGIGSPEAGTDAANRTYVDTSLTSKVAPVSRQIDAMESVMVTTDDMLVTAAVVGTVLDANVVSEAGFSHYAPVFVAPYPMRILSASVTFHRAQPASSASNFAGVALRRFRAGAGGQIVEKSTLADQPQAQTEWSLDGATWNEANRVLRAGDIVAFGASVNGTFVLKYPAAVTFKFARTA